MSGCILVVEDQVDNRQILRDLLGNAGCELTETLSRNHNIDAICSEAAKPSVLPRETGTRRDLRWQA